MIINENKKVNESGKIEFEDDLVVVKKNGKVVYKGTEDYEPMKDEPWKWDGKKYILSGGFTKEKVD